MHQTDTEDQQLLTYTEAARRMSVSRATLYRMIDRGDLTPVRLPIGGPRLRRVEVAALTAPDRPA